MPHIHEKYDYTSAGVLIYQDKTLLIQHKYLGGEQRIWTPPAGHVELDQDPMEAVYTEIEEEAGITRDHLTLISPLPETMRFKRMPGAYSLPLPFDMEVHPINESHRHIDSAYLFLSDTNVVQPGEGESTTWKWFSYDEVKGFPNIPEGIRERCLYALKWVRNL